MSKIAGIAAREISGVHDLGGGTARAVGALRERIPGSRTNLSQGVGVEVGEHQAAVDLDIVAEYGVAIADLANAIRRNVVDAVERMTGLEVTEVNITVHDVFLESEESDERAGHHPCPVTWAPAPRTPSELTPDAPDDALVDRVAAAALSVPGVHDLHGGVLGEVATYLPGRRVGGRAAARRQHLDPPGPPLGRPDVGHRSTRCVRAWPPSCPASCTSPSRTSSDRLTSRARPVRRAGRLTVPDRSERRAALKATHPDLGGDVEEFIAVLRAFDRAPQTVAAPAGGPGAAARGPPRPTITTTRRSRTARRARRVRRRLRALTTGRPLRPPLRPPQRGETMTTSTIGLIAGLLLTVAITTGGLLGLLLAIVLGTVGYLVGGHVDGELDVRAVLRGRRD